MSSMAKTSGRIEQWLNRDEWSWVLDHIFQKFLAEACAEHGVEPAMLPKLLGDSGMFMLSNFLTECALTEPVSPNGNDPFADLPGEEADAPYDLDLDLEDDNLTTVIDDYLARRGYRESATAKHYLEALRDTPVSVFEVTDVNPGRNITVRDLLMGGEPVVVNEKSGSKGLKIWDCVAARLVEVNGRPMFTGSLLPLTRGMANDVVDEISVMREEFAERAAQEEMGEEERTFMEPMLDLVAMMQTAELVIYVWLDYYLAQATGSARVYVNTDGDEIAFSFASFVINAGKRQEAVAALDSVQAFARADEGGEDGRAFWNWLADEDANAETGAEVPESAIIIQTALIGSRPVIGNIEVGGSIVEVSGNSENRRNRLAALVADTLGEMVAEAHYSDTPILEPDEHAEEIDPEVQAEVMAQFLDEHYRKLLDKEVPALGGQSPRRHVKTAQGRKAVIVWLKQHENSLARQATDSIPAYDISWVWEELGLDRSKA